MVPYPIAMLDHFYAMPFLTYLCQSADTSSKGMQGIYQPNRTNSMTIPWVHLLAGVLYYYKKSHNLNPSCASIIASCGSLDPKSICLPIKLQLSCPMPPDRCSTSHTLRRNSERQYKPLRFQAAEEVSTASIGR